MGKIFGLLISLIVLVGAALVAAGFYGAHLYTKAGPETADQKPRVVLVERGATAQAVAVKLKETGAIEDDFQFRTILRVLGMLPGSGDTTLKAGEYAIPSKSSMQQIVDMMVKGEGLHYVAIIPEGRTSAMVVDLLTATEWKAEGVDGPKLTLGGDKPKIPEEGSMLPGGYLVQRGDTVASVIKRAQDAQEKLMAELWPKRQEGLPKDIKTPRDAIILASIVENETGIAHERPQVAALFVNRLRKPMRLESDVTIVYGLSKGVPLGHGLRDSEIATRHAWNTYHIDGLPPTPICNPGREAIAAVLNPPQSKFLFFVADGSGGHVFAETYAEHLRNVAQWRKVEKQGGTRTPASGNR